MLSTFTIAISQNSGDLQIIPAWKTITVILGKQLALWIPPRLVEMQQETLLKSVNSILRQNLAQKLPLHLEWYSTTMTRPCNIFLVIFIVSGVSMLQKKKIKKRRPFFPAESEK